MIQFRMVNYEPIATIHYKASSMENRVQRKFLRGLIIRTIPLRADL